MCRPFFAVMLVAASLSTAVPARADDAAAAGALFARWQGAARGGGLGRGVPEVRGELRARSDAGGPCSTSPTVASTRTISPWRWRPGSARSSSPKRRRILARPSRPSAETSSRLASPSSPSTSAKGPRSSRCSSMESPVPEAQFGLPFHVEPREVSIEVRRGDDVLESKKTTFAEGASERVSLDPRGDRQGAPAADEEASGGGEPRPEVRRDHDPQRRGSGRSPASRSSRVRPTPSAPRPTAPPGASTSPTAPRTAPPRGKTSPSTPATSRRSASGWGSRGSRRPRSGSPCS
jgi:hypothetical protein